MIKIIPIHLPKGNCSPKKSSIHSAVNPGRMLLNALACDTPTMRRA